MHKVTERFIDALHTLHADKDATAMVDLYAEDATLSKLDDRHLAHGKDGARTFWDDYRAVFADIEVQFTHKLTGDDSAALEWTSRGSLRGGKAIEYRGVSVLEGGEDGIRGFRTYYDSAAFLEDTASR